MSTMSTARIPGWWQEFTGLRATALLDLLAAVDRQGASPNDRIVVTRLWREMALERALANVAKPQGSAP